MAVCCRSAVTVTNKPAGNKLSRRLWLTERQDDLERISCDLIKSHDLIAVEDLKVKNMQKNHKLAAAIADAGWRTLITLLTQKGQTYSRMVVLVPAQNTTQTCSHCGYVMEGDQHLDLSIRKWTCPHCGTVHNRDINAAKNILQRAKAVPAQQVDQTA